MVESNIAIFEYLTIDMGLGNFQRFISQELLQFNCGIVEVIVEN
jgi:hypothetical protein